jgi:hypothetical protein
MHIMCYSGVHCIIVQNEVRVAGSRSGYWRLHWHEFYCIPTQSPSITAAAELVDATHVLRMADTFFWKNVPTWHSSSRVQL